MSRVIEKVGLDYVANHTPQNEIMPIKHSALAISGKSDFQQPVHQLVSTKHGLVLSQSVPGKNWLDALEDWIKLGRLKNVRAVPSHTYLPPKMPPKCVMSIDVCVYEDPGQ